MADGSNLKAKVGMDTGDFERGAKKVAKAAQSMGKDMTTSLTDVGKAIGVDTGLLGDMAGRIQNATTLFRGMGSAGGGAASSLTKAMAGLGGAIAGLGITAAIAAFKELNAQADYFEQRLQGVNLAASAKAYRDTYRSALYDASGAGEWWANIKERTRNYFSTNFAEIGALLGGGAGKADREAAARAAERASQLASQMVDLKRRERDLGKEIQQIDNDIAAAQNTFKDSSKSANERKQAEARITELITQKYAKQVALQQEMLANVSERNSLTKSTEAELDEEASLEKGLIALQGQKQQELNSMLRTHNSIAGAVKSQAGSAKETQQATELTLAAATALVEKERALKAIQDQNAAMKAAARFGMADPLQGMSLPGNLQRGAETMTQDVLLRPVVDTEATQIAIMDLTDTVTDGVIGMSDAIGSLIGDLINGENAWGNFAQAGISVVADMLSTVGKAFITEGIGVEAAQMALKTGNGLGAIAAGGAMVALAAAMRTAMSNASANWSGGGSSVASSAYSGGSSNTPTAYGREMTVHVTGTLTGEGSKLVAVLNNEADRKRVTT